MSAFLLDDDLVLRIGSHQARLTPTEARALRYLLEHVGAVVARRTLETDVWGFRAGVVSEAVPVAVRQLRKKLGPYGARLQTIRGVGWRLKAPDRGAESLDALIERLEAAPLAQVEALATDAVLRARRVRPDEEARCVRAALRRCPGSLVVRLLAARFTDDTDAIAEGLAHPDPHVRLHAVRAQRLLRPAELDRQHLLELEVALTGADRIEVAGLRLAQASSRQDPQALAEMGAVLEEARAFPTLRNDLLLTFGMGLFRTGAHARAVVLVDAAIEGLQREGLDTLLAERLRALAALHLSVPPDVSDLADVAGRLVASGRAQEGAEAWGYAALVCAGSGAWGALTDALPRAGGSPTFARIVASLRDVADARAGDAVARDRVAAVRATDFSALGEHEDFSAFLAAWLPLLLAAATGDASAWSRMADLPEAPSNPEAALLKHLARSRCAPARRP